MLPRPDDTGNIYTVLLYRALESAGFRYVQIPFSVGWALRRRPLERFHYVHFHWPEVFFDLRPRQPLRLFGLKGWLLLHAEWLALKLRGYRLVWTVHEVDVHDQQHMLWAHRLSRRLLWRLADLVIAHSDGVRAAAQARWGARPHLHTIPHGSYAGAYPDTLSRAEARVRLGVPADAFVFAFFGSMRPYKGLELLLDAFRAVQAEHPEAWLVAAGRPYTEAYAAQVFERAAGLPNARLHFGFVPDDEVQLYLRAADCFVAPYRALETTGAIYLALAFELPVIVTSAGNVVELEACDIGIFMRNAAEVGAAMRRMLGLSAVERERLRANTRAAAELYSWDRLKWRYRDAFDRFEAEHGGAPATRRGPA
jgi:glycosyltransferase involved in cell wall biosynthesis